MQIINYFFILQINPNTLPKTEQKQTHPKNKANKTLKKMIFSYFYAKTKALNNLFLLKKQSHQHKQSP
jgi:hypothetical protein